MDAAVFSPICVGNAKGGLGGPYRDPFQMVHHPATELNIHAALPLKVTAYGD